MKLKILLSFLAALQLTCSAFAKDAPRASEAKPGQRLQCDPNATIEEEADKEIQYFIGKTEYIEYCTGGKHAVIIDNGDNN